LDSFIINSIEIIELISIAHFFAYICCGYEQKNLHIFAFTHPGTTGQVLLLLLLIRFLHKRTRRVSLVI
jgi:hypothetical protein